MNRTTELLKEIERYHKSGKEDIEIYYDDDFVNIQRFKGRITHFKKEAELRGRLDALKEEVEFIKNFQTNCLCERCGRLDSLHRKRLASIQEEIKLITDTLGVQDLRSEEKI